jgi:hypothetical protein
MGQLIAILCIAGACICVYLAGWPQSTIEWMLYAIAFLLLAQMNSPGNESD